MVQKSPGLGDDRSTPMGMAGQKGEAMGSRGDEVCVRNKLLGCGRPVQGCAGKAGPC